jgi:hypothetical protein
MSEMEEQTKPVVRKYILIKERNGMRSDHLFGDESELREHLEAMWKFTDWHLVAIVTR